MGKSNFEFLSAGIKEVDQPATTLRIFIDNLYLTLESDCTTTNILACCYRLGETHYQAQQNERRTPNDGAQHRSMVRETVRIFHGSTPALCGQGS
jgi:hypothetical protein